MINPISAEERRAYYLKSIEVYGYKSFAKKMKY